jgi:hypothetical protein
MRSLGQLLGVAAFFAGPYFVVAALGESFWTILLRAEDLERGSYWFLGWLITVLLLLAWCALLIAAGLLAYHLVSAPFAALEDFAARSEQARVDRERARQEEERRRDEFQASQTQTRNRILALVAEAENAYGQTTTYLLSAEQALDRAEREFADGAFAPFWDATEDALRGLAGYKSVVNRVAQLAAAYKNGIKTLVTQAPAFCISISTLPDAKPTAERLASVVRQAQRSPHFATIYELRRTNALLIAGFGSLGEAINGLGTRIEYSVQGLVGALDELRADVKVSDQIDDIRELLQDDSEAQREVHTKALDMLDDLRSRE